MRRSVFIPPLDKHYHIILTDPVILDADMNVKAVIVVNFTSYNSEFKHNGQIYSNNDYPLLTNDSILAYKYVQPCLNINDINFKWQRCSKISLELYNKIILDLTNSTSVSRNNKKLINLMLLKDHNDN